MQLLIEAWPIVLTLSGIIVFSIRQEGRINYIERANLETQKDVDNLRVEHNALNSKTLDELSKIRESLARIEGRMFPIDK